MRIEKAANDEPASQPGVAGVVIYPLEDRQACRVTRVCVEFRAEQEKGVLAEGGPHDVEQDTTSTSFWADVQLVS